MIYSISGRVARKEKNFVIIEVAGLGLKVVTNERTIKALPALGTEAKLFTNLYMREDGLELYGFATADEINFFELLISVSGVGPRSALAIMEIAELGKLSAAIKENRPDLLTRASGIGRKTAERIILELKNKVVAAHSNITVEKMEGDSDLLETLVSLGYRREEARQALSRVDPKLTELQDRLKAALKILSGK